METTISVDDFDIQKTEISRLQGLVRSHQQTILEQIGQQIDNAVADQTSGYPIDQAEIENTKITRAIFQRFFGFQGQIASDNCPAVDRIEAELGETERNAVQELKMLQPELTRREIQLLPELRSRTILRGRELAERIDYSKVLSEERQASDFFTRTAPLLQRIDRLMRTPEIDLDWDSGYSEVDTLLSEIDASMDSLPSLINHQAPSPAEVVAAQQYLQRLPEVAAKVRFHNDIVWLRSDISPSTEIINTPSIVNGALNLFEYQKGFLPSVLLINTRLTVELAAHVQAFEERVDSAFPQLKWQDTLTQDKIAKIIEGDDERVGDAFIVPEVQEYIDGMMTRFQKAYHRPVSDREKGPEALRSINLASQLAELGLDAVGRVHPVEERVIRSNLFAIFYLIKSGKLDQLHKQAIEKGIIAFSDNPDDTRIEKAAIAFRFIESMQRKNQEDKLGYDPSAPTIGFEYEFTGLLEEQLFASTLQDRFKTINEIVVTLTQRDDPRILEMFVQIQADLARLIKIRNYIATGSPKETETSKATRQISLTSLELYPSPKDVSVQLGIARQDQSFYPSYSEQITAPSAGYKIQLREFVQASQLGGLAANVNIHITGGNIELSPSRPEASDIMPCLRSTGWVLSREKQTLASNGIPTPSGETYVKPFIHNGVETYLPYYAIRSTGALVSYNTGWSRGGFELRSFPKEFGDQSNFINQVRAVSFIHLAFRALASQQKSIHERTPEDIVLVSAWDKYMGTFRSLLATVNIQYLPFPERFSAVHKTTTEAGTGYVSDSGSYPYVDYLDKIDHEVATNPEFAKSARRLVREFRVACRAFA